MSDYELDAVVAALAPLRDKTGPYLDVERREFDAHAITEDARAWSSGERLLVDVAVALWRGHGDVDLGRVVNVLDGPYFAAFVDALAARRGEAVVSSGVSVSE